MSSMFTILVTANANYIDMHLTGAIIMANCFVVHLLIFHIILYLFLVILFCFDYSILLYVFATDLVK